MIAKKKAMLAKKFSNKYDIKEYYVSEKLDGVRALYDGSKLVTRGGHIIQAPTWFLNKIPRGTFDGELFAGRGKFTTAVSVVKKKIPITEEWKRIQYRIFDDPESKTPFAITLKNLRTKLDTCRPGSSGKHVCLEPQRRVATYVILQRLFASVQARGGEGLMMRRADLPYTQGKRTNTILKMKGIEDAEATLIGFDVRGDGTLKSLIVEWNLLRKKKVAFHVGTGFDEETRRKWRSLFTIGDRITVEYMELTASGKARFPVFKGIRHDL